MDSIAPALVVIPTNSRRNHLFLNSITRSENEDWSGGPGVAGSNPVSPIRSPLQCSAAIFTVIAADSNLWGSAALQGLVLIP